MIKIGGGYRIWTGDQGFADPCLTTWLSRLIYLILMGRLKGIEPSNVGTTIRCVNHFATTAIFNNNIYYTLSIKLCQELFKIFFIVQSKTLILIVILINYTFNYKHGCFIRMTQISWFRRNRFCRVILAQFIRNLKSFYKANFDINKPLRLWIFI